MNGAAQCSSAIENAPCQPSAHGMACSLDNSARRSGSFYPAAFLLHISRLLTDKQFFAFGWRLPFLASAVLVFLGLYVRLTITETPVFQQALKRGERVKVPILAVFRNHAKALTAGIVISIATFVLFYLMTVFALSWGTSALGYSRRESSALMQLFCVVLLCADHSDFTRFWWKCLAAVNLVMLWTSPHRSAFSV